MSATWGDFRSNLIHRLEGKAPYNDTEENHVKDAWIRAPLHVAEAADKVVSMYRGGAVYSPWQYLAKICTSSLNVWLRNDNQSTEGPDIEIGASLAQVKKWMRNAGCHFDRWSEVHDDLFGDHGRYRALKDNPGFVGEVRDLWTASRESVAPSSWTGPDASLSPQPQAPPLAAAPQ